MTGVQTCALPISRTRQSHELNYKVTRPNKDCYKYSLYPRTVIKWNGLPAAAKSAPNVATFKLIVVFPS